MFAEELRTLRMLRGLTMEEMSSSLKVSRITYAKWEKGDTSPKADQIPKIAQKLGTTIAKLFGHEEASRDINLRAHMKMIEDLTEEDKKTLMQIIIALRHKSNTEKTQQIRNEIENIESLEGLFSPAAIQSMKQRERLIQIVNDSPAREEAIKKFQSEFSLDKETAHEVVKLVETFHH